VLLHAILEFRVGRTMPRLSDSELLLISKSSQDKLKNFSDGALLTKRARSTIKKLQVTVAKDRLALAVLQLRDAKAARAGMPTLSRTAVSRAYYAMYHAARAASYVSYGGDDHEQHSVLPTKFPADFPSSDIWKNRLKNARFERNRADYDPYPNGDADFAAAAAILIQEASEFIRLTRQYLRLKST